MATMQIFTILRFAAFLSPPLLTLALAFTSAALSGDVQPSAAEMLEKGIYTEETVGDLESAMAIYAQIVDDEKASRPHAARAQFRLGLCHLKAGDEAAARAALNRVIHEFPEQKELVAQARERQSGIQSYLNLRPVPWQDGEFLHYRMSLPTGKELGFVRVSADAAVEDGRDAWRLEMRRFVTNQADNYGVSRILVDAQTFQPIRSVLRHGILGNTDTSYGPSGAVVRSGDREVQVPARGHLFDNDQTIHLLRLLPLEPEYEVQFSILPTWTGTAIDVGFEVEDVQTCKVPAGEFSCYEVAVSQGETYWITTGPEQWPVKVMGGGITLELVEAGRRDQDDPVSYGMDEFDFAGQLPAGWMSHDFRIRSNKAMVRLLDPWANTVSAVEVDRCPNRGCPSLQETAQDELKGARRRIEDFQLRDGSWNEENLGGRPTIRFLAEYTHKEMDWVQYRAYTFEGEKRFEFIFRMPSDRFELIQPTLDSIVENLQAE